MYHISKDYNTTILCITQIIFIKQLKELFLFPISNTNLFLFLATFISPKSFKLLPLCQNSIKVEILYLNTTLKLEKNSNLQTFAVCM